MQELRTSLQWVLHAELDRLGPRLQDDEADTLAQWVSWVGQARQAVDRHGGRVAAQGTGSVTAVFGSGTSAVAAAARWHRHMASGNRGRPPERQGALRVGINTGTVYGSGEVGATGLGVLQAMQLASLAKARETIVSASARDGLVEGLDAEFEDLGDCHIKHMTAPLRAYRMCPIEAWMVGTTRIEVSAMGRAPTETEARSNLEIPSVVVVPLSTRNADPAYWAVGELLADRVTTQLSRSNHVEVISRLTGAVFRGRDQNASAVGERLQARYVLTGRYRVIGQSLAGLLSVKVTLTDSQSGQAVWEAERRGSVGEVLALESELVHAIASGAHHAMLEAHIAQAQQQPIQTLDHYALMLSGIVLMHRAAPGQFERSREALAALVERDPELHVARAWQAKWHVLQVTRSLTDDPQREGQSALQLARQAQQSPDAQGLALAMEGFVQLHLLRDFSSAAQLIERALTANPSESLAWLFGGVAHSFLGDANKALNASHTALKLSPMDPLLYYYESLAASSAIVARRFEEAIRLCTRSLQRNVTHLHTHRALVTAHWLADHPRQARAAALNLLRLAPGYTVAAFLRTAASANTEFGRHMAQALEASGVPAT
jgi:adenylate cyclase